MTKGFSTEDRDQPFSSSTEDRARGKEPKLQHEGLRLDRVVRLLISNKGRLCILFPMEMKKPGLSWFAVGWTLAGVSGRDR